MVILFEKTISLLIFIFSISTAYVGISFFIEKIFNVNISEVIVLKMNLLSKKIHLLNIAELHTFYENHKFNSLILIFNIIAYIISILGLFYVLHLYDESDYFSDKGEGMAVIISLIVLIVIISLIVLNIFCILKKRKLDFSTGLSLLFFSRAFFLYIEIMGLGIFILLIIIVMILALPIYFFIKMPKIIKSINNFFFLGMKNKRVWFYVFLLIIAIVPVLKIHFISLCYNKIDNILLRYEQFRYDESLYEESLHDQFLRDIHRDGQFRYDKYLRNSSAHDKFLHDQAVSGVILIIFCGIIFYIDLFSFGYVVTALMLIPAMIYRLLVYSFLFVEKINKRFNSKKSTVVYAVSFLVSSYQVYNMIIGYFA